MGDRWSVEKRPLRSDRLRRIQGGIGFSWIDRRFLRDGWIDGLGRDEILVYLFLVCVADRDGLSYYSDARIAGTLKVSRAELIAARSRLVELELVAWKPPLYQVLALPNRAERAGTASSLGELFARLTQEAGEEG